MSVSSARTAATPITDHDDISHAFEALRTALEDEAKRLEDEGNRALDEGEADTAAAVLDFSARLLALQQETGILLGKWEDLEEIRNAANPAVQEIISSRIIVSQASGSAAYCRYILETLVEMGGAADSKAVVEAVRRKIKMNYSPLKAARTMMAKQGWLKKSASAGHWEISVKGRNWLAGK